MKPLQNALLIFLRYPEPGKVKTRLAQSIGPTYAAAVYEKLIRRTLGIASDFKRKHPDSGILLFHTPEDSKKDLETKFPGPWAFYPQQGQHLGTRMENAFRLAFSMGAAKGVLIGTDLADIEAADIEEAFSNIGQKTAVLGPAADGGFYLVGLNEPVSGPFRFERWGTDEIFTRTVRELQASGFRVHVGRQRKDVDRSDEVLWMDRDFLFKTSLSVIVPTLSDPDKLTRIIGFLRNSVWPGDEIILVRGGEFDKVAVHKLSSSTTYVQAPRGRGIQQNIGAMLAKGEIFLFLHDDTVPPPEFPYLIRNACREPSTGIGCFMLAFAPSNRSLAMIAQWANLRTSLFRLPYGDQALFCRRDIFERIGGFSPRYLMEDVDLVRKCRRLGKLIMLQARVHSSPERYLRKGILTASLQNHATMLLSSLGRSDRELYLRYYGLKAVKGEAVRGEE